MEIESRLEVFEREQGSQIVVAIFRALPPDAALDDWTQRVAEAWRVGRAKEDDGAVLFAFVDDRALRLEIGYGLEGALTDLESKTILEEVLVPRLRQGNWDEGIAAAVEAILAAARGEYEPDPASRQLASSHRRDGLGAGGIVFLVIFLLVLVAIARANRGGRFSSGGWRGGGFQGGGSGGGGFGGFSGGGGSFGGGGASSRW